jgi:hypothetical protein
MKKFIRNFLLPPSLFKFFVKIKKFFEQINYSKKDFENNLELKDIHTKDRCFVIGLGNSINNQDLTLLKDEVVIAVSGFFTHKDINIIMPEYYVLSPIFKNHGNFNKEERYISWLKAMDKTLDDRVKMIIHISDKCYVDKYNLFVRKKVYWNDYSPWFGEKIKSFELNRIPSIASVSEAAVSVAIYLGFSKIYMIGFDHTWYEKNDNHFDNKKVFQYFKKTQRELNKEFKWDSEIHMRNHADIFKKYKRLYAIKNNIFNANADENTYVDTFPKVRYEDLF